MVFEIIDGSVQTNKNKNFHYGKIVIENNVIKGVGRNSLNDFDGRNAIFDTLANHPHHIGQIDGVTGRKITFKHMKDQSISLAIWLRKQGVKPGDMISLCSPNHSEVYSIIIGTLLAGATYSPFMCELNLDMARYFINLTRPKVLFTYEKKIEILQKAALLENLNVKIIVLDYVKGVESLNDILTIQTPEEIKNFELSDDVDPENIALIAFSSGTTGLPKGIMHSYGRLLTHIMSMDKGYKTDNEISLSYFYPEWAVHMDVVLNSILTKATQILHPEFEARETCRTIEQYKVTTLYIHTYSLILLCNTYLDEKYDLDSVTTVVPVGVKISQKVINKIEKCMPHAFIVRMMGLTESDTITRYTKNCTNPLSAGKVLPGVELKIVNQETGKKLGPNKSGELCVKLPWMMIGYLKNPAATKAAFDNEGYLKTGDEAYYDENGELVVIGRIKEIIKYKVFDVQPLEIEDILRNHPNVTDAAVVSIPHDTDIELPVAFVTTVQGTSVEEEELVKMVDHLKFDDILKSCIHFLQEMPRNSNRKINKHMLKELAIKLVK